ncbi:MAG: ParA family protein [Candidatus Obscuribacterales bacterium]
MRELQLSKCPLRVFTSASGKGGTGKSTLVLHIGYYLAKVLGLRVLLVDLDPQGNLSLALGVRVEEERSIAAVLKGQTSLSEAIVTSSESGVCLVPSHPSLDGIERTRELANDLYGHERLRNALKKVEHEFDFCFIDPPPGGGWLPQTALYASHHMLLSIIPEAFSVLALAGLKEFQERINLHHGITIFGAIFSCWDERGAMNATFIEEVEGVFGSEALFKARVRRDVGVNRAVLEGKTIFEVDPKSRAAQDYKAVAEEFCQRIQEQTKALDQPRQGERNNPVVSSADV